MNKAKNILKAVLGTAGVAATAMLGALIVLGGAAGATHETGVTYLIEAPTAELSRAYVASVGGEVTHEGNGSAVGATLAPNQVRALRTISVKIRPWNDTAATLQIADTGTLAP